MNDATVTPNSEYKTACGGKLKVPTNYPSAFYKYQEIYFCTLACFRAFEKDPEPFMAGEVKHPVHEKDE